MQTDYTLCLLADGKISPPPMTPRDYTAMVGERFFEGYSNDPDTNFKLSYNNIKDNSWPELVSTLFCTKEFIFVR